MATERKTAVQKKERQRKPTARKGASEKKAKGKRGTSVAARVNKAAKDVPKGGKLTTPERMLRDTLMLTRVAQGWSIPAIAAEAKINQETARLAIKRARESHPLILKVDPAKVVEDIMLGLWMSIGDFEALAVHGFQKGNIAAAVGAKKGANAARGDVIQLLQDVGRLPQDLDFLGKMLDLRSVAEDMIARVDGFVDRLEQLPLKKADKARVLEEAAHVRDFFDALIGDPVAPSQDDPPLIEAA